MDSFEKSLHFLQHVLRFAYRTYVACISITFEFFCIKTQSNEHCLCHSPATVMANASMRSNFLGQEGKSREKPHHRTRNLLLRGTSLPGQCVLNF
jgi:hypothetical protein